MSCPTPPTLCLKAGQNTAVPFTFTSDADTALDLTGSTVHFMAKTSLTDADAAAVIDVSQASHTDAANGATALEFDLTGLGQAYFEKTHSLHGDIWVVDGAGDRIPYGAVVVEIQPSAKYRPTS